MHKILPYPGVPPLQDFQQLCVSPQLNEASHHSGIYVMNWSRFESLGRCSFLFGFDYLGDAGVKWQMGLYRGEHLPRKSNQTVWFESLGRCWYGLVLTTWEMLRWFGFDYLGDVEMVWFRLLGRCWDGLVFVPWEMLRWFGFGTLGDVEMVWFWSLGRRTVWFCKLAICKRLRDFVQKDCLIWVPWEM